MVGFCTAGYVHCWLHAMTMVVSYCDAVVTARCLSMRIYVVQFSP